MNRTIDTGVLSIVAGFLLIAGGISGAQAGQGYSQVIAEHPGWVQVPGQLMRPDCVHEIPNGAKVEVASDGKITGDVTLNGELIAHYDACPEDAIVTRLHGRTGGLGQEPGTGNGWVEASQWDISLGKGDNIDFLGGIWTVPSKPSTNGALIYLFNGIEPSTENWILQPVLQYGAGPAGGGNYWAIASWLVGPKGSPAYHSSLKKVKSGDSITGFTVLTGISSGKQDWWVSAGDGSIISSLKVKTSSTFQWTWAFAGVLEAYGVTSCSEFPASGSAKFWVDPPTHGYPAYNSISPAGWYSAIYPTFGGPSCGYSVTVGTTSTLFF